LNSCKNIIESLISQGVIIPCPDGVVIDSSARIGEGTVIYPGTIIKEGCVTEKNCVIGPFSVLYKTRVGEETVLNAVQSEEAVIGSGVKAGPFVHIRPGSVIKDGVKIGNFVEIKNSEIGEKTAVSHLTYVGDSDVGTGVNFGCGTVTVNFNGKEKNRCKIGDNAFIGCNTNLVAPVEIGDRAYTAAGSTITEDVPPDSLAIARTRQTVKADWVKKKKPYRVNSEFGVRNSENKVR
jgi:bifunctional UDP-N-acetylglucosamine pyrophosphorylase/glucosamine-1-phosphate N-acetyltransferase